MAEQPPAALAGNVGTTCTWAMAQQIARMGRRVRRLARDLPPVRVGLVDASLQARILTSFQAAELNAGRGPSLRIGPYVILEQLGASPYYVACYRGRNVESQEAVRLAVIENAGPRAGEILAQRWHPMTPVGRESRRPEGRRFRSPPAAPLLCDSTFRPR